MRAGAGSLSARAVVLVRHGERPRIERVGVRPPGSGEVCVKMFAAGICYTDIAAVRDARIVPIVLGHDGAGVVESIGQGVDEALLGCRVLLSWKTPCGACRRCAQGRSNLCEQPRAPADTVRRTSGDLLAVLLDTGCFRDYVVVPAAAAIPVPDGLGDVEAALVGCAVATGLGAVLATAKLEPGPNRALRGPRVGRGARTSAGDLTPQNEACAGAVACAACRAESTSPLLETPP